MRSTLGYVGIVAILWKATQGKKKYVKDTVKPGYDIQFLCNSCVPCYIRNPMKSQVAAALIRLGL